MKTELLICFTHSVHANSLSPVRPNLVAISDSPLYLIPYILLLWRVHRKKNHVPYILHRESLGSSFKIHKDSNQFSALYDFYPSPVIIFCCLCYCRHLINKLLISDPFPTVNSQNDNRIVETYNINQSYRYFKVHTNTCIKYISVKQYLNNGWFW